MPTGAPSTTSSPGTANSRPTVPRSASGCGVSFANGLGGLPLIGSPDDVAEKLAAISTVGFTGIGVSPVNYGADLPFLQAELFPRLERLGLREPP